MNQLKGHKSSHNRPARYRKTLLRPTLVSKHVCRFCCREFLTGHQLGGHTSICKLNPNYSIRCEHISNSLVGRVLSQESIKKIKQSMKDSWARGDFKDVELSRTKWYSLITKAGKEIRLQGTWELKLAQSFERLGIPWFRNTQGFPYNFEGDTRTYYPDFILGNGTYVEVKGYKTGKDRAKWAHFPHKLVVMSGWDLDKIQDLSWLCASVT